MITATYIQHCGNDLMVVNAARVSFAKESAMFSDKDAGLISYLARHNHKSPFNHAFVTFHVKAPVICGTTVS
jgi:thymidylate synthase (FAD)